MKDFLNLLKYGYILRAMRLLFRILKMRIIYFFMIRNIWKRLFNAESEYGHWEVWPKKDTVVLHYVIEEDYSKNDIMIEISHDKFKDLIKLILRIS